MSTLISMNLSAVNKDFIKLLIKTFEILKNRCSVSIMQWLKSINPKSDLFF